MPGEDISGAVVMAGGYTDGCQDQTTDLHLKTSVREGIAVQENSTNVTWLVLDFGAKIMWEA